MKDKEIKGYVSADRKARNLWSKSKQTDNPKKQQKLQGKAKDAYAERDAYAMRLQNPITEVKTTNINVDNSFNDNFNKTKKTTVNTRAKFSFGRKNSK